MLVVACSQAWSSLPLRKPAAVQPTWMHSRRAPPADRQPGPIDLTRQIVHASSTLELLQLHAAHGSSMDAIHFAALFNKLLQSGGRAGSHNAATAQPVADQPDQQQLLEQQQQQLYQQQQHPEEHRQVLLQVLLADLPRVAPVLQPGPVAVILRALTKLDVQVQPQLLLVLLHRAHVGLGFRAFSARGLCTVAHALTELQPVELPWVANTAAAAAAGGGGGGARASWQQAGSTSSSSSSSSDDSSSSSQWSPVLLQDLFYALGFNMQRCNAQDAAQAVLAATRLQHAPSEAWLRLWLLRATQLLPRFTPQGLANSAYGLVRVLQLQGELVNSSGHDWAGPREPTDSGGSSSSSSDKTTGIVCHSQEQQQQQGTVLAAARTWLQSCLQVSVLHLSSIKPQELIGQLLWAAGKMGVSAPEPAGHYLLAAAHAMLPACDARNLVAALYAMSMLNLSPDDDARGVLWASLSVRHKELSSRDLCQVLWCAARLQIYPPRRLRDRLQAQALWLLDVEAGAGLSSSSRQAARHAVGILKGMVDLGWELQDRYVVRFQGLLQELLPLCVPQDYANMLWALATAGASLEARWLDRVLMAASSKLDQFKPQELCNTLRALALLQHNIPKPWMQQLLLVSLQQLSQCQPADHAALLAALAKLQFTPSPLWLSSFWAQSGRCLADEGTMFTATQLHGLLLAAVGLQLQPPQRWVQAAAGAVERGLSGFLSQQLLEVLRALQQLQRAASVAAGPAGSGLPSGKRAGSSTCRGHGVRWSSSQVPLTGSSRTGSSDPTLRLLLPPQGSGSTSSTYGSGGSGSSTRPAAWSPGMIRLGRQRDTVGVAGRQVLTAGLEPSGAASADEAYSLACLVLLMPPHLHNRMERWPQLLAAGRAARQQQQQQGLQLAK